MERQHKSEMVRVLDAKIKARSFDGRAVLLFGHCNATEEMVDYLLAHEVAPVAILDNSVSKRGLAYCEIPIICPEIIRDYTALNSVILIATRFYADMSAQCRRLGYDGEIVQVVEYNSFAEYSLLEDTVKRKIERMERGRVTLEKLRRQYAIQHLVVCPNNALGDVYWAMSFLSAYRKKNNIGDVVVIVIGNACKHVAELFGIINIVAIESKEMDEFVQAVIYTREDNCIIAHHDRPYTDNIIKWLDKHFLSFIDYYKCAVFGLAKDTESALPHVFLPFKNEAKILKGKSVILSPYAKSIVELPLEYWERIVAEYISGGYSVYTNVIGDEQPIKGTAPLTIPISQMVSAVEYAGSFVGIRSGLCDVITTANCHKIVVFPDCFYSTTPYRVAEIFALPGWDIIRY